jgi:hypothetical protein
LKDAVNIAGRGNLIVISVAAFRASLYHLPTLWLGSIIVLIASNVINSGLIVKGSLFTGIIFDPGVRQKLSLSLLLSSEFLGRGRKFVSTHLSAVEELLFDDRRIDGFLMVMAEMAPKVTQSSRAQRIIALGKDILIQLQYFNVSKLNTRASGSG